MAAKKINILVDPIKYGEICTDHSYCESILNKINEYVNTNNKEIPQLLLDRYIYIVCNNILCWSVDYEGHKKNLEYIFTNCKIDPVKIINSIKENTEVVEIMIKNNKDINMNFFTKIPNSDDLFSKYIENFIKDPNCTEKTLEVIFSTAVDRKYFKSVNKILDMKFKISDSKLFDNVIFNLIAVQANVEDILKKCINNGAKINKDTLQIFIDRLGKSNYYQYQCIHFQTIFTFLYTNGSTVSISELLKVRPKVPIGEINATLNNLNDLALLEFTKEEFKELCECSVKINNFKNVKKYFDDKEIKAIIYSNKITYPIEFDFDINILRAECKKTGNINEIKKILKTVKPDQICMENACTMMNIAAIKLLREEYKIPITEKCIYNSAKSFGYNRIVTHLVTEYEKNNNIQNVNNINDSESEEELVLEDD